jgi:excisionase family DNA binding protein
MTGILLTEPEVADRLRVSLACLRRWRLERRGPRFLKVGSRVRYPTEELDRWIDSLPVGGTVAGEAAGRQTRGAAAL